MRTIEQIRERIKQLRERAKEIHDEAMKADDGEALERDSDEAREWNEINEEIDREQENIRQIEIREERLSGLFDSDETREDPPPPSSGSNGGRTRRREDDIYDLSTVRTSLTDPRSSTNELRSRALKSLEGAHFYGEDVDQDATKAFLERMTDPDADSQGVLSRYLLATGSPVYKRAFGKLLAGQMLTREETAAAEGAQLAERALSLTGAAGGFAVPYVLDPTLMLVGGGVVNPIRQISRVVQITVDEWRGLTTSAVTAAYEAEATEVADQTPTIAQPTISTEKAQAWVAASIEINQDWSALQSELANLFADAKETLEAQKFASGSGTNEPFGVLTGVTNTVNATTGQTFTLANLYALMAALPPRYRQRASFVGDLGILNLVRQFDTAGGSAVWEPGGIQAGNPDRLLSKPVYEASEFPDTPATGNKFLVYGDFGRGYVIVDRIGMNIEVVPHVFGANRRPTGQRGFYCYWRNSAKVVDASAFRALLGIA